MGDFVWVFTSASGRDKPSRRHSSTSPTRVHYPFFRERIQRPLLQELWKRVQRKLLSRQSYTQNLQVCLLLRVRTWTFLYSAIFSTYFLSAPSNIPFKSDSETHHISSISIYYLVPSHKDVIWMLTHSDYFLQKPVSERSPWVWRVIRALENQRVWNNFQWRCLLGKKKQPKRSGKFKLREDQQKKQRRRHPTAKPVAMPP